jgi:type IV pilus assembly protein PilA
VYVQSLGKSQLNEAFTVTDALRPSVAEFYNQQGSCPTTGQNGISQPASYAGKYVSSVRVKSSGTSCIIDVTMNTVTTAPDIQGKTITFAMNPNHGVTRWTCSSDVPVRYLPQSCR